MRALPDKAIVSIYKDLVDPRVPRATYITIPEYIHRLDKQSN